jgi:hypothetical protein
MLITVFCTSPSSGILYAESSSTPPKLTCAVLKAKLEHIGILPLTRADLVDILTSPWCEKHGPVFMWAKEQMHMTDQQLQALAEEVAVRSLGMSCKVCPFLLFLTMGLHNA